MGMGVFQQKEPKMPGAHKIGAVISGPRIYGRKFYGHHAFSDNGGVGKIVFFLKIPGRGGGRLGGAEGPGGCLRRNGEFFGGGGYTGGGAKYFFFGAEMSTKPN